MEIREYNNYIEVVVSRNVYNIDVLHKCFYWYGKEFSIEIDNASDDTYVIKLFRISSILSYEDIQHKIRRDLVDFRLRDIVTKETQNIRELLIAKAFAYYDTTVIPSSELSDPVGFNINDGE